MFMPEYLREYCTPYLGIFISGGGLIAPYRIFLGVNGTFNGSDCDEALLIGEQRWCIPALTPNPNNTAAIVPEGLWSVVETN
jgi:hypothetical protein